MNHPLQGIMPEEQRLHPVVNDFRLKSTSPTTMFHGHNSPPLFNLHNPFFGKIHPRNIIGLQFPNLPTIIPDPMILNRVLSMTSDDLLYTVNPPPCAVVQKQNITNDENSKYAQQVIDSRRKAVASTNALKSWLFEHRKNPYPTKGEKIMLAILTKMSLTQVSTWFANARRRLKKECITTSGECDLLLEGSDGEIDVGTDVMHEAYTCNSALHTHHSDVESAPTQESATTNGSSPGEAYSKSSYVSRNQGETVKRQRIWSVEDMIASPTKRRADELK